MNPSPAQPDSSVTRLVKQVVPQKMLQVAHDLGRDHGVKTVATVVAADALEIEASSVSSHGVSLL
jgi:hypothetical protein